MLKEIETVHSLTSLNSSVVIKYACANFIKQVMTLSHMWQNHLKVINLYDLMIDNLDTAADK